MASSIPEQYRAVDPFASYNSNTVNQLTEMRSRAENVLDTPCGLDVFADATSVSDVIVQPGYCFKDDVLIYVSEEHTVDFTDPDHYVSFDLSGSLTGWYYVVIEYTYVKSRPSPQAKIKIVMPDQRGNYSYGSSSTSLIFLKAVQVSSASPITISTLSDFDPTLPNNKREFAGQYAGGVTNLPTHDSCRDKGRFAYDVVGNEFYFGYAGAWIKLGTVTASIDTSNVNAGELCYVDSAGLAAAAISTSVATGSEILALNSSSTEGTGVMYGYVEDVVVQTAIVIAVGDLLYLSATVAGSVTNVSPSGLSQVVGRALSVGNDSTPIDILFFPRAVLEAATASRLVETISAPGDWSSDSGSWRYDIDVSSLNLTPSDQDVIVSCRDTTTNDFVIEPQDIDLSVADTVTIWMPVNTVSLSVTVVG